MLILRLETVQHYVGWLQSYFGSDTQSQMNSYLQRLQPRRDDFTTRQARNLPVLVFEKDLRFTAAETRVSFFSEVSGSHIETHGIPCLTAQAIVH